MTDLPEISKLWSLIDKKYHEGKIKYSERELIKSILLLLENLTVMGFQGDIETEINRESALNIVRLILND